MREERQFEAKVNGVAVWQQSRNSNIDHCLRMTFFLLALDRHKHNSHTDQIGRGFGLIFLIDILTFLSKSLRHVNVAFWT
jgi:hypothetical protein